MNAIETSTISRFRSRDLRLRLTPDCCRYPEFRRFAERARAERGWRSRHLATGHDAMITRPRELATVLLEIPG